MTTVAAASAPCFSALQRAENSSILLPARPVSADARFQCSSASRKFLNRPSVNLTLTVVYGFSALQRAENSSIDRHTLLSPPPKPVSVLFSEPKIPQFVPEQRRAVDLSVSVLFSEPKIPQFLVNLARKYGFEVSVLFSEPKIPQCCPGIRSRSLSTRFQCSSASRKFLNLRVSRWSSTTTGVSVLFSEPKIPQWCVGCPAGAPRIVFQCSSASRKFLNLSCNLESCG